MRNILSGFVALAMGLPLAAHADESGLFNKGLIEQTLTVQGSLKILSEESGGSTTGANVIQADRLRNEGDIRQHTSATSVEVTSRRNFDTVTGVNVIRVGPSATDSIAGLFR